MFARIAWRGGKPGDREVVFENPMGVSTFSGATGSGKTTLAIRALCVLLFGTEPDGSAFDMTTILTGEDDEKPRLVVEGVTRLGTVFRREITAAGTRKLSVEKPAEDVVFRPSSEEEWLKHLGGVGKNPAAARLVLVPEAWCELAGGNARPLRDALARLSGVGQDLRPVVARLMGEHALRETDPLEARLAEPLRAAANKASTAADATMAAEQAGIAALDGQAPPGPSAADVEQAIEISLRRATATRTARVLAVWEAGEAARAEAEARRTTWLADKSALDGRRPVFDEADLAKKEASVARVEAALVSDRKDVAKLTTLVATARARLEAALHPPVPAPVEPKRWEPGGVGGRFVAGPSGPAGQPSAEQVVVTGSSSDIPKTRMFSKQELLDHDLPRSADGEKSGPTCRVWEDVLVDTGRRWSEDWSLVFSLPDMPAATAWRVDYSVGKTEVQEERPWENDETVEATLVHQVSRTVLVWEPVP